MSVATLERRLTTLERAVDRVLAPAVAPPTPLALFRQAGYQPDQWQIEILEQRPHRGLLCCCRQAGKSSVTAALAVHNALYSPGSLTLLLSPTLRQSSELLKTCLSIYRAIGRPGLVTAEGALSLEIAGGGRIVSLPGTESSIRGFAGVNLLIVDEAARVPEATFASALPMIGVSNGAIIVLSTPFGKRGFFWNLWNAGGDDWARWHVAASACPRWSDERMAEASRVLGSYWYEQEIDPVVFLDSETAAFNSDDIDRAFSRKVVEWTFL